MKSIKLLICLVAFSGFTSFATDLTTPAAPQNPKNLNEQYRALSAECDLIGTFRMMKLYKMDQFWKSVQDSLHKKHAEIKDLHAVAAARDNEITTLKTSLKKNEGQKASLQEGVDSLHVFGKAYSKTGFITGLFVVMAALAGLAVALFMMYQVSFGNAREFRKLNEALYQEFEDYKHHAVEKQIKLSRELQNYRNRVEELKTA